MTTNMTTTSEELRRLADVLEDFPDVRFSLLVHTPPLGHARRSLAAAMACGDAMVTVDDSSVNIKVDGPVPVRLGLYGEDRQLAADETYTGVEYTPLTTEQIKARLEAL